MADTGAPWNIPYVEPSDLVRDYPAADEAQALAIAAGLTDASLIRQVVQTVKTDTFSSSLAGGGEAAVTGLAVTITPTSATSKVFVMFSLSATCNTRPIARLFRGGSGIFFGDAAGSRIPSTMGDSAANAPLNAGSINFAGLDSPGVATAVTYSVSLRHDSTSTQTVFVNRGVTDTDGGATHRTVSTITAIEVAA